MMDSPTEWKSLSSLLHERFAEHTLPGLGSEQMIGEGNEVSRPKIQRVPEYMAAKAEFQVIYTPQIISVGFGRSLILGRGLKYRWAAMYFAEHTDETIEDFSRRIINSKFDQFIADYDELHSEWYGIGSRFEFPAFTDLLIDGWAVLQVLEKSDHSVDPERDLKIRIDNFIRVHQDLLIMDNQIHFKLLRILCNDEARLNKCLQNFLQIHGVMMPQRPSYDDVEDENKVTVQVNDTDEPLHLLDYLRRALLMRDKDQIHKEVKSKGRSWHLTKYRIGTVRELKEKGIRVMKHPKHKSFYPIFDNGKLILPELTIDGSTAHIMLNLMAYEMCPDFRNDFGISSFVVFMSSLIEEPEDVKELRLAGILINELANDKQVADLFNKMDVVLVPETAKFAHIRDEIKLHIESRRGMIKMLGWMGEAYDSYFRSPWTIIALLAGTFGLVLTFIQTWFAMHPKTP